jgi:hypothetical protein
VASHEPIDEEAGVPADPVDPDVHGIHPIRDEALAAIQLER